MDTSKAFDGNGVYDIPNPNYKKGSKKQPKTITTNNFFLTSGANTASEVKMFNKAASETWQMENTEKYSEYGITPNNKSDNLNNELANAQGTLHKFGNSLAQTVVSEIGLGTVKGLSDLIDFVGQSIGMSDKDYSNPVSQYLEEKQEEFKNYAPVYVEDGVNIANGGLLNAGWWASNIPSIASSITLLLPAEGVVKGVSLLGKATKVGAITRSAVKAASELTKSEKVIAALNSPKAIELGNLAVKNGMSAALQRTMENYQEARGVYTDMYNEANTALTNMSQQEYDAWTEKHKDLIKDADTSNKDEVAKAIARNSADEDFKNNFVNIVSDVIQLYALRNRFGEKPLAEIGRSASNKAQREAIRNVRRSLGEEVTTGFKTKVGDFVKDHLLNAKLAVAAQLGEGVEEGINFISQQEAMDTGRVLLGTSSGSNFDNRLYSYFKSPQLWESMFWGVLGGVVFEAAGSKLSRIQYNLEHKNDDKTPRVNETTGEEKPNAPSWSLNSELPEVQRKIAEINGRAAKLELLKQKLATIKEGKDPYDEEGKRTINENEASILKNKVIDETITDMSLEAMNNGNSNLLKAYMSDDSVRQLMVSKGFVSEEDSKAFQQTVVDKIDTIREEYNKDLSHLNRLAANLDTNGKIPFELLQKVATDNVWRRLNIKTLESIEQPTFAEYNNLLASARKDGKLKEGIDYNSALELRATVWALSDLYKEQAKIKKDIANSPTIGGQLALEEVNGQIDKLQKSLYDVNDKFSVSKLLFATANLSVLRRANLDKADKVGLKELRDTDKAIVSALKNNDFSGIKTIFGIDIKEDSLNQKDFYTLLDNHKTLRKSFKEAITEINKLGATNNALSNAYNEAFQYRYVIAQQKAQLVGTVEELKRDVTITNNTLSEMRREKLKLATDTFTNLMEKYGRDSIEQALASRRIGDTDSYNQVVENYSEEDKNQIDEAIKVFNFANPSNTGLYDSLEKVLDLKEILMFQREKQKKKNTTKNQNPSQSAKNNETNNVSSNENEAATSEKNDTTSEIEQPLTNEETVIDTSEQSGITNEDSFIESSIVVNADGNVSEKGNLKVPTRVYNNGDTELVLTHPEVPTSILQNDDLFTIEKDVSIIDNNYKVTLNPIIRKTPDKGYQVVRKGVVSKISLTEDTNGTEDTDSTPVEEVSNDTSNANSTDVAALFDNLNKGMAYDKVANFKKYKGNIFSNDNYIGKLDNIKGQDVFIYYNKNANTDAPLYMIPINSTQRDYIRNNFTETKDTSSKPTTTSSTGGLNSNSNDDAAINADASILNDPKVKINGEVITIVKDMRQNGNKFTMEDVAKLLYDKYSALGVEDSILTGIINNIRSNPLYNKLITEVNKKLDAIAGVEEAQNRHSALEEETVDGKKKYKFTELYSKAADTLFDEYISDRDGIIRKDANGKEKVYFSFQDLLKWCNEISETSDTAYSIYGYLKQYILEKSKDSSYKYRIIDEAALDASVMFDNKSNLVNNTDIADRNRVNIRELLDFYQESGNVDSIKNLIKALDSIKNGDALDVSVQGYKVVLTVNNTVIGTLPVPYVSKTIPDTYEVINDNWLYDVNATTGESNLKDIFKSWITESTEEGKEINDIIYALSFDKTITKEQKEALYDRFINNKEIKNLVEKGVITGVIKEDVIKAANGLVKLYRYISKVQATVSGTEHSYKLQDSLLDSVDDWFEKLRLSYNTIDAVSRNPKKYSVVVDSITSGRLTKQVEDNGEYNNPEVEKQANVVKDAVADSVMENFEFGFIPTGQNAYGNATSGTVYGINGSRVDFPGTPGNTFGMIKNQNGVPQLVRAYPVKFGDNRLSKNAIAIQIAIKEEFNNLLEDFYNKKEGSYEALRSFINKVFDNENRLISRGFLNGGGILINDMAKGKGFTVAIKGQPFSISITNNFYNGELKFQTAVRKGGDRGIFANNGENKEDVKELFNQFIDRSGIGIHFDAMNNAINEKYPLTGFMSRTDSGEFVVTIPNSKTNKPTIIKAKSYKDFLIDNNLVKINLKKVKDLDGKDTNFTRTDANNQLGNQTLYVRFKENSGVTETINPIEAEHRTTSDERVKQTIDILTNTSGKKHKGNEIALITLGSRVKNMLKPINGFSILPKSIIFDASLNSKRGFEKVNAIFNPKDNSITVGPKWIEMLKNPDTKAQAIRKLIHEQLHYILSQDGNSKYIEQIRSIRDEFIEANIRDGLEENKGVRRYEKINDNDTIALEEFLVESLTSKELVDRLNQIDSKVDNKTRKKSLFQKIANLICKIFNWDVRKGSLYEKEMMALADILKPTTSNDIKTEINVDESNNKEEPVSPPVKERSDTEDSTTTSDTSNDASSDLDSEFDTNIEFDDMFQSAIDEESIQVPNVKSFIDSLPLSNRASIREQIDKGEISTRCK